MLIRIIMSGYSIIMDGDKCTRCLACVAKCKKVNKFAARVFLVEPVRAPAAKAGFPHRFLHSCHHCAEPKCLAACPHGAMVLAEDGVVRVLADKCNGCAACVEACPWHIPVVAHEAGPAVKCTLCDGLAARGEEPACVKICPEDALRLVELSELADSGREAYARTCLMHTFLR